MQQRRAVEHQALDQRTGEFHPLADRDDDRLSGVDDKVDVLLTCSSGGHLLQLLVLREVWEPCDRVWVTDDRSDTRSLLADEQVVFAHWPTSRTLRTLPRNLALAWRVVRL